MKMPSILASLASPGRNLFSYKALPDDAIFDASNSRVTLRHLIRLPSGLFGLRKNAESHHPIASPPSVNRA